MKILALILSIVFTASAAAFASTATGTIGVSTTIVPGNTLSAYLVRGEVVTEVSNTTSGAGSHPYGVPALIRISFNVQDSWYLVKRVTWNKMHHQLTIDF